VDDPRLDPQAVIIQAETNLDIKIVGTGDFIGDGKEDILWRNVNPDWEIAGVGDYDRNNKTDIFWRRITDGRITVWIMDGLTRLQSRNLTQVTNTVEWKVKN